VTSVTLDLKVCHAGFADAMTEVGWLTVEKDGVTFPRFDRHNGKPAKDRALAKDRQSEKRSRDSHAKTVTREEKRREEIKQPGKEQLTSIGNIPAPEERVAALLPSASRIESKPLTPRGACICASGPPRV
jgi:hypothetical protein